MYAVYERGIPARFPEMEVDPSWDNHQFPTFLEAITYAKQWLGEWDTIPEEWDGKSYDYDGYGDTIEIRKEE
jgi:hypothetical protein